MSESLYIIIPAYNEADSIRNVIEHWYPIVEKHNGNGKSRLVIIDDGSRDDTLEIVKNEVRKKEFLEVITKENGGHGSSIYFGYQYALQENADWIFQTDSDGQTMAEEFCEFWNARYDNDVIIGNRVNRGDGIARKIVGRTVRMVVRFIFGVSVKDTNTPYRLMHHKALEDAIRYVPKEYNLTNIALTSIFARMQRAGQIEMSFLPITFRPRQAGKNSINVIKIVRIGIKALADLRRIASSLPI